MTTMIPAQELRDVIRVEIPPAVAVAAVEIQIAAERLLCRHRNRFLPQRRHRLPPRFRHQLLWSILIIRMQVINRLHPICLLI